MYRTAKPKLSLSISTAAQSSTRPSLSLTTAMPPRTPISPSPMSPTAINTRVNGRGYSTSSSQQSYSYAYSNSSSSKSILKKGSSGSSSSSKKIQFSAKEPTVYCVTPIENKDDVYGAYVKMSRDERRWGRQ